MYCKNKACKTNIHTDKLHAYLRDVFVQQNVVIGTITCFVYGIILSQYKLVMTVMFLSCSCVHNA